MTALHPAIVDAIGTIRDELDRIESCDGWGYTYARTVADIAAGELCTLLEAFGNSNQPELDL